MVDVPSIIPYPHRLGHVLLCPDFSSVGNFEEDRSGLRAYSETKKERRKGEKEKGS